MYSKIILIAHTTAMMKDPRARDPAWYLKIHQSPVLSILYHKQ